MNIRLTDGKIAKPLLLFSMPMIAGNLLQQLYNVADTFIVGQTIGATALSAVGSSYSLMVLLTSIILGLCMGSGVVFFPILRGWPSGRIADQYLQCFFHDFSCFCRNQYSCFSSAGKLHHLAANSKGSRSIHKGIFANYFYRDNGNLRL